MGSYKPEMQEIDSELVHRALPIRDSLLVDSRSACAKEAGELIKAAITNDQMTEIGEVIPVDETGGLDFPALNILLDKALERFGYTYLGTGSTTTELEDHTGPVTIFKSVGIGLQDVAIAAAVVASAEALGIGHIIDDYDA